MTYTAEVRPVQPFVFFFFLSVFQLFVGVAVNIHHYPYLRNTILYGYQLYNCVSCSTSENDTDYRITTLTLNTFPPSEGYVSCTLAGRCVETLPSLCTLEGCHVTPARRSSDVQCRMMHTNTFAVEETRSVLYQLHLESFANIAG